MLTIFLLTVYNTDVEFIDKLLCNIIGYFGYFSTISMFSWMTIMSFDLAHTLLKSEPSFTVHSKSKFFTYSIIAWGMAILMTSILLVFQLRFPEESDFNPQIGKETCFIFPNWKKLLFLLHLPIFAFMITNLSLFISITSSFMIPDIK